MYVDVHLTERQIDAQTAVGEFAGDNRVAVRLLHRRLNQLGFDEASVDKKVLIGSVRARRMRLGQKSVYPYILHRDRRNRNQVARQLPAEHREYRLLELSGSRRVEHGLAVADAPERDLRMTLRRVLHHRHDIARLGEVLFEELHARRCVVKQIADDEGRAVRTAGALVDLDRARLHKQMGALERSLLLGEQVDAGDRGDCRERLAAEAERADRREILLGADLAGRMTQKRRRRVRRLHAASVVLNAQIGDAAVFDLDGNLCRTGVDGIFNQLFADRGRPFDHFSRRNQIGHMGIQFVNNRHSNSPFSLPSVSAHTAG